jgi:sulfatase modifying factor 1
MTIATNGGINYNAGNADGSKYSVKLGDGNHPVNVVTWYDAVRFANWMNNGQGNGDTETGAYTLLGGTPTPSNAFFINRNAGATVFLPSENEWYKAAYNIPGTNSYFRYPTSSNATPTATAPTATPNSVNSRNVLGHLTDVGAYTGTTSPYGAFDMGGNVWQWNEASIPFNRGERGGAFNISSDFMLSSARQSFNPAFGTDNVGFRLASTIPEPSSLVLAALGFIGLAAWRLRRR